MHVTVTNLAESLLWSVVGGIAAWLALTPFRRGSLRGLLASLVVIGAAASLGGLWGAVHTMLLPDVGWQTITVLSLFAVAVPAVAALALARRLARDNAALQVAVADIGAGRVPQDDGRRLIAELDQLRSELNGTAAALAATRERERALETARRDLVSWVSHDLRTPLAGLQAMAEALEDGIAEDPDLYYKQIGLSVEQLNRMVEDLFDLSRIQAGTAPRTVGPVALNGVVTECLSALGPLAAASGVRLAAATDGAIRVVGDGSELNRALTNLVANAIRHTPADGVVEIRVDAGDGRAEVVVRDECGGIPEAHLARVFEVGYRGELARTPGSGTTGAGLGLAITRGIVEAHAGTVGVANRTDGCEFRLQLPLA